MSVLNRLFGQSKSSGSERKSGASNARLWLESLEVREVPAVVGGVPASPGEFPYQVSVRHAAADSVPTDRLALNFAKIEFNAAPASSSLTVPESRPEPTITLEYLLITGPVSTAASDYLLELDGIKGESADRHGTQAPASDYLLELDGVKGESRAAGGHREQANVESISWGGRRPAVRPRRWPTT